MKIKFIPIDYDYFDFQGRNYIKVVGRSDNGEKTCIIDSCDVYFWVILKEKISEEKIKDITKKIEKIKIKNKGRESRVIRTLLCRKKFLGRDVHALKVFITNYKDAHDIAEKINFKEVEKRRGYDIGFISHYILEKKLKPLQWYLVEGELLNGSFDFGGIDQGLDVDLCIKVEKIKDSEENKFSPRVLAYDIETDEFEIGKGQILMISLAGENFKKVLTWKGESDKDYIEKYKDEADMLRGFVKHVKEYEPDILTGYFSDGFDLPYIRARAEKNRVRMSLGIDKSQPSFSRGRLLTGKIKGIVHIDLLRFIRVVYSQYLQSETLSLDDVANELLGEGKSSWEHKHSSKIKDQEWKNYFEYNLKDSVLTYNLFNKIWLDILEFVRIIQEPLFDVSRDSMSAHVENYIIHNLDKFNEIVEKRPYNDEIGSRRGEDRYEGGFVFQPIPGLYEDIVFFDFTSMYASVIVSYNISKSTYLEKKEKNTLEVDLGKEKAYFSKEEGFFSNILAEIIQKRKEYKKDYNKNPDSLLKARSNAFKLLANAAYGYQGFFGARYYCLPAAAATAALARKSVKEAISYIEKKGYRIVYSDTDSIAFLKEKKSKKEIEELLEKINKKLPGIMELDLEGFYKRGIWVTKRTGDIGAKKKYALIDESGKIKIRGFETVRRDWCTLARETQNKVLEMILKNGDEKKAINYLKEIVKKIKNRDIELKKLIIRTQLKKSIEEYKAVSPHVTIAKKMKEKQMPVNIGMLIEYYIAESHDKNKKNLIRDRAKMPDESGKYDIEYYLKNQILPSVENIFEVFKVNVKELLDGKKQMSLGDF